MGAVKLLVTSRALRLRRDRPELFTGYTPLIAAGPAADHLFAFDRGGALTAGDPAAGRSGQGGWMAGHRRSNYPAGEWIDELTGQRFAGGTTRSRTLLGSLPGGPAGPRCLTLQIDVEV